MVIRIPKEHNNSSWHPCYHIQRRDKRFFDYNQNAKNTMIQIQNQDFLARLFVSAAVSMPVKWKGLENIVPSDFTTLENGQDLAKILYNLFSKWISRISGKRYKFGR
jgi:DNA primase